MLRQGIQYATPKSMAFSRAFGGILPDLNVSMYSTIYEIERRNHSEYTRPSG